jgi:hypothetical protein
VPTPDSRYCWIEGARSINGTISRQKPRKEHCGCGASLIQLSSPTNNGLIAKAFKHIPAFSCAQPAAAAGNPVDGVKRPMANGNEGSTPALGDRQARKLLEAPPADTLKGVRVNRPRKFL